MSTHRQRGDPGDDYTALRERRRRERKRTAAVRMLTVSILVAAVVATLLGLLARERGSDVRAAVAEARMAARRARSSARANAPKRPRLDTPREEERLVPVPPPQSVVDERTAALRGLVLTDEAPPLRLAPDVLDDVEKRTERFVAAERAAREALAEGYLERALEEAETVVRETEAVARALRNDRLANPARRDYALALLFLGHVQAGRGDLQAAQEAFEYGLAVARAGSGFEPGDVGGRTVIAGSWMDLGDVYYERGAFLRARDAFERCARSFRKLADQLPEDPEPRFGQAQCLGRLGVVQQDGNEITLARSTYERGAAIVESLVRSDPENGEWKRNLAAFWQAIGDARGLQANYAAALEAYERWHELAESLAGEPPFEIESLLELGTVHQRLCQATALSTEPASGIPLCFEAIRSVVEAARRAPGDGELRLVVDEKVGTLVEVLSEAPPDAVRRARSELSTLARDVAAVDPALADVLVLPEWP